MRNVLLGVTLLLLAACSEKNETAEPAAQLTVDLAAGRTIAQDNCSTCHGMDGRGETDTAPNLAAQPADYMVESLHAYKEGQRLHAAPMNLASGMSDADIRNVAAYYASLPKLSAPPARGSVYQMPWRERLQPGPRCSQPGWPATGLHYCCYAGVCQRQPSSREKRGHV